MTHSSSLGPKIKELRKARGMTLEQVGNIVGVGKSTVRKWETGMIANMGQDKLASLAEALGVHPGELMGWNTPPSLPTPDEPESTAVFPVIGEIAAGFDHIALDEWDGETVEIPTSYMKGDRSEYFVLRIKGDSMYPLYMDGDRVLIHKQDTVDYGGQIAAIMYDDDLSTLKRVEMTSGGAMRLIALNPMVPPIKIEGERLDHCRIIGVPKILIRSMD